MPPDARLMKALNFTEADLMENRRGQLSYRQQELISRRYHRLRLGVLIILAVGLAADVVVLGPRVLQDGIIWLFLGAPIAVMWLMVGRGVLRNVGRYQTFVRRHLVYEVTGVVRRLSPDPADSLPTPRLQVGEQVFAVTQAVHAAFEDGRPYRVFYLPLTMVVISAEPAEMGDA